MRGKRLTDKESKVLHEMEFIKAENTVADLCKCIDPITTISDIWHISSETDVDDSDFRLEHLADKIKFINGGVQK